MKCPACGKGLVELTLSDIKVDVCQNGCHGLWLDDHEIEKVDEAHESTGEKLLEFLPAPGQAADRSAKRICPRCPETVMQRYFFSVRRNVEIDDCPVCGGTWLDAGELARIRSEFKTKEQRDRAAKEIFSELFDKELAAQSARSKAELERARKFARAFKYILPSYWIPGKQQGGAF